MTNNENYVFIPKHTKIIFFKVLSHLPSFQNFSRVLDPPNQFLLAKAEKDDTTRKMTQISRHAVVYHYSALFSFILYEKFENSIF